MNPGRGLHPLRRCRVGADGTPEVTWMQGMEEKATKRG